MNRPLEKVNFCRQSATRKDSRCLGESKGLIPCPLQGPPRKPAATFGLGLWTLDIGPLQTSPAGGSTNATDGHNPLQPGRWPALRECDRPTVQTSGASSTRPDNRSGLVRNSPQGLRPAGSESWSWSSWQVPFVRSAIGADQLMRGVQRVERLVAPGHILPFSSELSPEESPLSWRLAPRNAHGFASHGTPRNVSVDGQFGGSGTGLSAAQVDGHFPRRHRFRPQRWNAGRLGGGLGRLQNDRTWTTISG